MKVMKDFT